MAFSIVPSLHEHRDLGTGNEGVLIPTDSLPTLIEAKKAYGQLASEVGQKVTRNGEPLRIAGVDDTTNRA